MSDIILSNFSNLDEIDPDLSKIGTSWLYQMPFFYTYFANTTFEKVNYPGFYCGIAPHNNSFKIAIGPDFIEMNSGLKKEGALVHEYLHIIMETFGRQGERDRELWNISTDYAINEEVLKHQYSGKNLELPAQTLRFDKLVEKGYNDDCIAEKIYDWIEKQAKQQQQQQQQQSNQGGQGQGQDGQGQGGQNQNNQNQDDSGGGSGQNQQNGNQNPQNGGGSGEGDENDNQDGNGGGSSNESGQGTGNNQQSSYGGDKNFDDHSGLDQFRDAVRNNPIIASKVKKIFEEAQANHEVSSKGIGSNAGSLYEFIKKISKPTVRWRGLLHATVQSHLKGSGHKSYSWSKKNRKDLPFPGKKRFNKKVVLAVDTSGSISSELAERFFSEIDKIAHDHEVYLVQFDTKVQNEGRYKKGDWRKLKFTGRGGTSCDLMFDHIAKDKKLKYTVVVVFSDGGFYKDYNTHGMKVIWCIAGDTTACENGKIVEIKDY